MWWLRVLAIATIGSGLSSCSDHTRQTGIGPEAGIHDGATICAISCSGTCTDGRCLVTLATATSPSDIALDDARVYFTECPSTGKGGTITSVPLGGGSPSKLASGSACAASLALAGSTLYVAGLNGNDIASIPRYGGTLKTIASSSDKPVGIAVGDTHIYWSTQGGVLMMMPLTGGSPSMLASCPKGCTRPVAQASDVYWGDSSAGTIQMALGDGGAPVVVTSGLSGVGAMAISGDYIYFASDYLLGQVSVHGGSAMNVGLPTGAPVGAIAADSTSVYFTSWGSVLKIGFTDIQPTEIAANQGDPNAIAVNGTSVYWTNADAWPSGACCGQVMKLTPK
jgi:hypothetical protein